MVLIRAPYLFSVGFANQRRTSQQAKTYCDFLLDDRRMLKLGLFNAPFDEFYVEAQEWTPKCENSAWV